MGNDYPYFRRLKETGVSRQAKPPLINRKTGLKNAPVSSPDSSQPRYEYKRGNNLSHVTDRKTGASYDSSKGIYTYPGGTSYSLSSRTWTSPSGQVWNSRSGQPIPEDLWSSKPRASQGATTTQAAPKNRTAYQAYLANNPTDKYGANLPEDSRIRLRYMSENDPEAQALSAHIPTTKESMSYHKGATMSSTEWNRLSADEKKALFPARYENDLRQTQLAQAKKAKNEAIASTSPKDSSDNNMRSPKRKRTNSFSQV